MSNIKDISGRYKIRRYETDYCKGCNKLIMEGEEYTEVVLPNAFDDRRVTHIALCKECSTVARKYGAF